MEYLVVSRNSSAGIATRYGLWTVRESNPGGGEIFRTRPDRPWAHPVSCTMGAGFFPGVKRPGRDGDHPPTSSAKVKEGLELYLYSPFGPLWPVLR
jgi:hypothetical protein